MQKVKKMSYIIKKNFIIIFHKIILTIYDKNEDEREKTYVSGIIYKQTQTRTTHQTSKIYQLAVFLERKTNFGVTFYSNI